MDMIIFIVGIILIFIIIMISVLTEKDCGFQYSTDYWWSVSGQEIKNVVVARLVFLERQGKLDKIYGYTDSGIQKVTHWIPLVDEEEIVTYLSRPMERYKEEEDK